MNESYVFQMFKNLTINRVDRNGESITVEKTGRPEVRDLGGESCSFDENGGEGGGFELV